MAAIASEYLANVLEPEKFATALFGVTIAFAVLSANAVGLRTWVRRRQFSIDDYLMSTALVCLAVHTDCSRLGERLGERLMLWVLGR